MTDLDAMLRAVLAEPDDDGPRLVYADMLDDLMTPEASARAAFIRAQVELARLTRDRKEGEWACRSPRPGPGHRLYDQACGACDACVLREQADALLDANAHVWLFGLAPGFRPILPDAIRDTYARGFVERLSCTAADWLAHADAIRAAHPVRRVRLTTLPDHEWQLQNLPSEWPGGSHGQDRRIAQDALEHRWPGITFDLPPPRQPFNPYVEADFTPAFQGMYELGRRVAREQNEAVMRAVTAMGPRVAEFGDAVTAAGRSLLPAVRPAPAPPDPAPPDPAAKRRRAAMRRLAAPVIRPHGET